MAPGGIYDHLGGGFARYSVDDRWLVPHFEKMLYDQALLRRAYLHAWQVTGLDRYRQVARRDRRLRAARPAPSRGRVVLGRGRRQRGRGGQVLRVDARAGDGRAGRRRGVGRRGHGLLRGVTGAATSRAGPSSTASPTRATWRPRTVEEARPGCWPPAPSGCGPAWTTRSSPSGTRLCWPCWPRRPPPPAGPTGWAARGQRRVPGARAAAPATGAGCARGRPDGGARHLAYAADHAALVDAFTRLYEATGEARWIAEAGPRPTGWSSGSGTPSAAACSPPAGRRAPGGPQQGPDGQRHAQRQQPGGRGAAAAGRADGRPRYRAEAEDILRLWRGRWPPATPPPLGHLLAAVDMAPPASTRSWWRATGPTSWPRSTAATCRVPSWPGGSGSLAAVGGPRRRPRLRVPGLRLQLPAEDAATARRPAGGEPRGNR